MRRISPGTVTVGVLAILIGLAAAYAAKHYFNQKPAPKEILAAEPPTTQVVVAGVNLPQYTRVVEDYMTTVEVPVDKVPQGAVTTRSRALFRLVKHTTMAGEPIMEANLYAVGEVPLLSDRLPPGHRAATLSVDIHSAINGMIQPESRVDVSLTVENDRPEIDGLATLTLMKNVLVLATSDSRFPRSQDRPREVRNITVAVTPEQANKLILAEQYGTLSVTLCSSVDAEVMLASTGGNASNLINTRDLLGLAPIVEPEIPVVLIEPLVEPIRKTTEIWRGDKMSQVDFGHAEIQEAENMTAAIEGRAPRTIPVSVPASGDVLASGSTQAAQASPASGAKKAGCTSCSKKKGGGGGGCNTPPAIQSRPTPATRASYPGGGSAKIVQMPGL